MDDLPTSFDIIIVGTGMPECIIAAAAARVGKKVLHLDRNAYYGGDWASFSYDKFLEWMCDQMHNANLSTEPSSEMVSTMSSFLQEGENLVACPTESKNITNLVFKTYVKEFPDPPRVENGVSTVLPTRDTRIAVTTEVQGNSAASGDGSEEAGTQPLPQEWTLSSFMVHRRKFNIDLAPKLLFSRGSLVELLISSNIARYAEFQCITRVLTHINGHIEQVPCSRADVFSTKSVTVTEKRMLMKFLTFCMKFEEQTKEYEGYVGKPFVEFLKSRKLTSNVEHYVVHAIAMVDKDCLTLEGLKATQKFLQSLGRYGKSPFLCTCYGSAELPQSFCRLCAVYEGMYYLKRKAEGIILSENRCHSIISMGQRLSCEWLVMESSYVPTDLYATTTVPQNISRAVLIIDASVCPSEKKENTLLRIPPGPGIKHPVTVLELNSKSYVCPEDLFLVYMSCRSTGKAEDDLKAAIELLFTCRSAGDSKATKKPNLLWSAYFNQKDTTTVNLNAQLPQGMFLTSTPDVELDYEHAVKEAQAIFEAICPGEEFLPRAPDPEDIIIESHNNPGDDGDGGKIENDVGTPEDAESVSESKPEEGTVTDDNISDANDTNDVRSEVTQYADSSDREE